MKPTLHRILVIRNDKIGDFMLSFPAFALLKTALPDTEIHALVPAYTEPMAEACEYIDKIVIDPGKDTGLNKQIELLYNIKENRYDAAITLFSTNRTGICLRLAGIPYRLAPATKIAQIFYNRKLTQRRSLSEKPEFSYNLDIVKKFLSDHGISIPDLPIPPYLHFEDYSIRELRKSFCKQHNINPKNLLIFIHPGSGGSANNLSPEQFACLGKNLQSQTELTIIISAGPGEETIAEKISAMLPNTSHSVYFSDQGLCHFAKHIQFADLFISGSTGPLHIAGALDRPTAGFYTRRKSATALRWQTLNSESNRLAFSPPDDVVAEDMSTVDIDAAARKISKTFLGA